MFNYPLNKNLNISSIYMNTDLKNYIKQSNKKIFENHLQKNKAFSIAKIELEFNNDNVDDNDYESDSDNDSDYFFMDLDLTNNEKPKKNIKKTKNNNASENDINKYQSIKQNNYIINIVNFGFGFIIMTYISYRLFVNNTKY